MDRRSPFCEIDGPHVTTLVLNLYPVRLKFRNEKKEKKNQVTRPFIPRFLPLRSQNSSLLFLLLLNFQSITLTDESTCENYSIDLAAPDSMCDNRVHEGNRTRTIQRSVTIPD